MPTYSIKWTERRIGEYQNEVEADSIEQAKEKIFNDIDDLRSEVDTYYDYPDESDKDIWIVIQSVNEICAS